MSGNVYASSLAIGTAGKGGSIDVTANTLRFLSNTIDASGTMGGGRIRLGGEYQGGKNLVTDEIQNAKVMFMTDAANITAKTTGTDGEGGRIIAWVDQKALVLGQFDTTPGTHSGAGGFVEVSSGDNLTFGGSAKTGLGDRLGTLLLDPKDITIATTTVYDASSFMIGKGYVGGTLTVASDSNALTVGETITGGTSGATGVVVLGAANSTSVNYTIASGTFVAGETVTGGTSGHTRVVSAVANDIDASTGLQNGNDRRFGRAVALDGKWLAVGATETDGHSSGSVYRTGTVFLFSYTDTSFSGEHFRH